MDEDYTSGITFSGGDPLYLENREVVTAFAREIKEKYPEKTIWLYTGYLYEEIKGLEIMNYIDVLCDGPFMVDCKDNTLHWVGSSNQRVIDIPLTRKQGEIVIHETESVDTTLIEKMAVEGKTSCSCGC